MPLRNWCAFDAADLLSAWTIGAGGFPLFFFFFFLYVAFVSKRVNVWYADSADTRFLSRGIPPVGVRMDWRGFMRGPASIKQARRVGGSGEGGVYLSPHPTTGPAHFESSPAPGSGTSGLTSSGISGLTPPGTRSTRSRRRMEFFHVGIIGGIHAFD